MIRKMRRILCALLVLIIACNISGCAPLYAVLDEVYGDEAVSRAESIPYVGFSVEEELVNFEQREAAEFSQVECVSNQYNSTYFYDLLSPDEQIIYNTYLYAMEHGYLNVLIDEKLATDAESLIYVLECLSYDSPLLEQNLRYQLTTFTAGYSVNVMGTYERQAEFKGICIRVFNFDEKLWEKKLEAIDEAKRLVSELPQDLSEKEKAERLYRYVMENVKYKEYNHLEEMEVRPYLYDALIKKKSHCDGYTNALTLLFQMAGIEALEKTYTADTDEVGHTWNVFKIGDHWYNADAVTNPKDTKEEKKHRFNRYFGFADLMQNYIPDKQELYPKCEDSLGTIPIKRLKKADSGKFRDVILDGLHSKKKIIIVLLDEYDEDEVDVQMQNIANDLQGTVNWLVYTVIEARIALYIYQ